MADSEKKFAESLGHDNTVNGKTILSREHILRTCKSEVRIEKWCQEPNGRKISKHQHLQRC